MEALIGDTLETTASSKDFLPDSKPKPREEHMPTIDPPIKTTILIALMLLITACGPQSAKRAGQGAAVGGLSGAAAGMVSALIWGGNVGEAAARGAAWGATSGAVSGAIVGSQEDQAVAQQQRAKAEKELKQKLGDDGFAGLAALVQCKHKVALGYAETAQESSKEKYRQAGLWLEALTYYDQGELNKAESMYDELIAAHDDITSTQEVDGYTREAIEGLTNIRKKERLPVSCSK